MSGQYPPPNPAHPSHPFSRVPVPSQRIVPPWGHTSQPSPGLNMVRNPTHMNFYNSPHMGLRNPQSWAPPQTHPKPPENRPVANNPLFGLQMLMTSDSGIRIPSEYQQEETIDLSSHSAKTAGARQSENTSDVIRNGSVLSPDSINNVNGEVERTEVGKGSDVSDSIGTSVIASNPMREGGNLCDTSLMDTTNVSLKESAVVSDVNLACVVKGDSSITRTENEVGKTGDSESVIKPIVDPSEQSDVTEGLSEPVNNVSSVLKTTSSIMPIVINTSSAPDIPEDSSVSETPQEELESDIKTLRQSIDELTSENNVQSGEVFQKVNESGASLLDSSALSVDTNESKLIVAESSAEDIFGMSPVDNTSDSVTNDVEKSQRPSENEPFKVSKEPPVKSVETATPPPSNVQSSAGIVPPADIAEAQPSVENVEILLESMFNATCENSVSSQVNNSGVPKSVIVSSGTKITDPYRPTLDINTPMKEEELASTLAEDNPVVPDSIIKEELTSALVKDIPSTSDMKEEKREHKTTDEVMDEIEKKLEMLTECVPENIHSVKTKEEPILKENEETEGKKNFSEGVVESIPTESETKDEIVKGEITDPVITQQPSQNPTISSSNNPSNPFIEVETELEKMFAGIVEPTDEGKNETLSQPSVSENKKPEVIKKTVTKRKKTNNRRPSDSSFFGGGSSGESTPIRKRGRKRLTDVGNERASKKIKMDSTSDTLKKKKLPKDVSSDSLSSKLKGPFVHIEGPKESPSSVVVVNSGVRLDDEDGLDKASSRRKHSSIHRNEGVTSRKAYSSSTLSARYNSDTADLSWVCVFCHKGPHCEGGLGGEPAGDLFGPYRIPATPPSDEITTTSIPGVPSDRDIADEQKRRGGKFPQSLRASGGAEAFVQKMVKKSKRSVSNESHEGPGLLPVEGNYEIWLHGACAEWAPGLCVVGTTLIGLDDAVWTAIRTKCSQCGQNGAVIGCVVRACPGRVHYHCALLAGWMLDYETFVARCHVHRTRLRPS